MARFQQRTQLDFTFANLLSGLLCYDPDKRLTPAQAAQHPFLAPEVCLSYLRSDSGSQHETISTVFLSQENYKNRPQIAVEICRQGPSSTDLLRMGTNKDCKNSPKHVSSLVPPSESHRCAASHLHESSCQLQTKSQHSSSGEHRDMCLNIASVSMCARLSMSDRESQTCEATPQDLHESRTTCTHLQDRGSPGEVSRTSQARESAVVLCQSPDTTCVMETSQVVTHNDDQQHLRCCVLYNKSPETDVEGFHCAQQCSQNNICRTVEPQVSTSSKRVHGKLQKIHITSLNKSLAVSRHEATQARALAADSSAKGFLLHKPAPTSRYSTERQWKECGSSKGLAKNSPCPQDLGYKEGLVMSQEHKDHSCKSTCSCEDTENPVHSRSLNETFTIKEFSVDEDDVLGVVMNFPEISASLVQVGSPNRSSPSKTEAWCQSEAAEDYPGQRNTRILGFSKTSPVELLSRTESRCGKSEFPSSVSCNIHDVSLVQSDSVGHCKAPLTLDAEVGLKYDKKTAKNDDAQVKDIQLHSLSSSTVNSFNSKNLDMSCADVTFDSDCSNDSSHERFRNFIDTVSQDTPLAQPYRVWDQTNRQHRMQADSVSHTQVNIIPQSSLKSKAGWTALFPDGRPDDLNVSSFVQPSHCLKSNSAKNVRSETSKCSWKLNKNAQNVLASVGQKVFSISGSLAGDEGHDQDARGGGHHRTAVVTIGNMILSDSSSKLKAPRRRNLFGICKKTKGSKRIQVDAFAKKNGTTTCGITPSHQDGVTSDGTLLLPQDPYLRRTKRRTKSRVCQDLSSCRIIIPEKNKRRNSARNKSKEVLNPLLKQAVRQFLPKIRSPQGMLAKGKGHESLSPGQFREKEFLPRSSKVTEYTQPQDKLTSCDNIQISSMLPCNRKKKCKYDVSMLSNWPCGSIVPNFSVSKTEITGPIFSEGETERHISGCNFSVGKAETDISQSVYSSSVQVNPDLGFSNNSNLGEDKLKKVVPNDSLPGLKLGASHLKSSLVGKKRDMGRISLATPALHTLHRDPQVQRASKEEENQHLMFPDYAVDKMCNVRQRHTDKPRSTLEMPDDGDDDVIMLIQ
ncbi:uncharacterized protein LOC112570042 isoform X2 [Pomacea canaliculata]|nr:uncharacterized protein LOC112570042 isoform X2 [Pomacea canaliculata]